MLFIAIKEVVLPKVNKYKYRKGKTTTRNNKRRISIYILFNKHTHIVSEKEHKK